MEDKKQLTDVASLISTGLGIEPYEYLNYDQLLVMIAERVKYLLENDKDLLLSYLYRLDISMKKINRVLKVQNIVPAHESLAILILQRQKERVETKKKIIVKPIGKEWEW